MYDRDVLNQLRSNGDLLLQVVNQHVSLSPAGGGEWKGRCPFHQEKTASFYVVADKGFCHCFGCGWGGDVFDFVQELLGLEFRSAVEEVADEAGVSVTDSQEWKARRRMKSSLLEVCSIAAEYYRSYVGEPEAQDYLEERGLLDAVEPWQLGYAPDNWGGLVSHLQARRVDLRAAVEAGVLGHKQRFFDFFRDRIIFPIRDNRGRIVGFAGRSTAGQQPKYLNTPETPLYRKGELLFGLAKASPNIRANGRIVLVEGYTDVIACHAAGVAEAVAACGTALTEAHVTRISRLTSNVVECKDPDSAGMAAMEKDLVPLVRAGMNVTRVPLPGLDPDELFQQQGGEALATCVDQAHPLLPEVLQLISRRFSWTPQGRQQAAEAVVPLIRSMRGLARDEAVTLAARALNVDTYQLRRMVGRRKPHAPIEVEAVRQLNPLVSEVIWALVHHPDRADPIVRKHLRPEWMGEQERLILHLLMQGSTVPVILLQLEDWAQKDLRQLAANRAKHGAGQVRSLTRESCLRIELGYVEARMGAQVNGTRFGLQRRRLELLDSLALRSRV